MEFTVLRNIRGFEALHFILTPTSFSTAVEENDNSEIILEKKGKRNNNKSKLERRKPSSEDSKSSTLCICSHNENVVESVKKLAEIQKKKKLNFNPVIVIHLNEQNNPAEYYVFIDHLYLKLSSFEECLLIYLKSFFVYDLEYPKEGRFVCLCLQEIAFAIDSQHGRVQTFIKDMEKDLSSEGERFIYFFLYIDILKLISLLTKKIFLT